MKRTYPDLLWCRYADDGLVHCRTEREAEALKADLQARLAECHLELHPVKTRIVYCKDRKRNAEYPNVTFDFLGYCFRPRLVKNTRNRQLFCGFHPAVSPAALKNIRSTVAENGSALFTLVSGYLRPGRPLSSIPLPAGEPRRLGSFSAQDAAVFPDGRIVFTTGTDLFVAGKGGENMRKLVSLPGNVFSPSVSPDGQRIVVTFYSGDTSSFAEVRADGTDLRTIIQGGDVSCGAGLRTVGTVLYLKPFGRRTDIWALPMQTGLLHRSRTPTQLTVGPLSYSPAIQSGYGKQILAIGAKGRGESVHFDMKLRQFLPFLSGISATDRIFSRDRTWVAIRRFLTTYFGVPAAMGLNEINSLTHR